MDGLSVAAFVVCLFGAFALGFLLCGSLWWRSRRTPTGPASMQAAVGAARGDARDGAGRAPAASAGSSTVDGTSTVATSSEIAAVDAPDSDEVFALTAAVGQHVDERRPAAGAPASSDSALDTLRTELDALTAEHAALRSERDRLVRERAELRARQQARSRSGEASAGAGSGSGSGSGESSIGSDPPGRPSTERQASGARDQPTAADRRRYNDIIGLEAENASLRSIASRVPALEARLAELEADIDLTRLHSER